LSDFDFNAVVQGVSDFLDEQDTGGEPKNPPLTDTASAHGITIRTAKGRRIARIQSWAPAQNRIIDAEHEVDANATGEPIERVPQIVGTNRISVERYELYVRHIGEEFGVPVLGGASDMVSLANQIKPLHVRVIWRDPFGGIRGYVYTNAWFSDWGITIGANDDRIIKARATLEFERRLRLA
jgi:hypothetical protein